MIDQIIFLSLLPITSRDRETIKFDYLNRCGFRVSVFILSGLLGWQDSDYSNPRPPYRDNFTSYQFHSFQYLEKAIREAVPTSLFIDCVMDLTLPMARIFRMFKKYKAKYFALDGGMLPTSDKLPIKTMEDLAQQLRKKLMKALDPRLLFDFLIRRLLSGLRKYVRFYPCPDKILCTNPKMYLKKYHVGLDRILLIPSHDYYRYLEYKKTRVLKKRIQPR